MSRPTFTRLAVLTFVAASALAPLAMAQERDAGERQRLLDLAYTLGESHALRQACQGETDQYWRARMVRLTEVEQADQAFDAQMREKFNTGFAARHAEYPTCDDTSRKAEQQVARRGQALAQKMSQSMRSAHAPPAADAGDENAH